MDVKEKEEGVDMKEEEGVVVMVQLCEWVELVVEVYKYLTDRGGVLCWCEGGFYSHSAVRLTSEV